MAERWTVSVASTGDPLALADTLDAVRTATSGADAVVRTVDGDGRPGPAEPGGLVALLAAGGCVAPGFLEAAEQRLLTAEGPVVVHPEYVVDLDAGEVRRILPGAELDWRDVVRRDPWPGASAARADVHLAHPLIPFSDGRDRAAETWAWNAETAAAGVVHEVLPATVAFRRSVDAGATRALLPALDLAGLRLHLPEPHPVGAPSVAARRVSDRVRGLARRMLSPAVRRAVITRLRALSRLRAARRAGASRHIHDKTLLDALSWLAAQAPGLAHAVERIREAPVQVLRDDGYAEALAQALSDVDDRARALILVPWLDTGHAHSSALNYARVLQHSARFAGRTAILGTDLGERTVHIVIPGDIKYAHLSPRWLSFPPGVRAQLLAQLIVLLRPELILTVGDPHLPGALARYAPHEQTGAGLYALVFDHRGAAGLEGLDPDALDGVVVDEQHAARTLRRTWAGSDVDVLVHPLPVGHGTPPLPLGTRAYNNEYFSARNPFRLLVCEGPEPARSGERLAAIMDSLAARGVPVVADVWTPAPADAPHDPAASSNRAITWRGTFSGDLFDLDTYGYHALLLADPRTDHPLFAVQALLRGLPVIAAVGAGIGDLIKDRVTGLLLSHSDDVRGFTRAVEALHGSVELRRDLIGRGYEAAVQDHAWEVFARRVGELAR